MVQLSCTETVLRTFDIGLTIALWSAALCDGFCACSVFIFPTAAWAVFELIYSTNLEQLSLSLWSCSDEKGSTLRRNAGFFLRDFVVCSRITRPIHQQSGLVVQYSVISSYKSLAWVDQPLNLHLSMCVSLYLQLHSWADCIEPLNGLIITHAHGNLPLNVFCH